MNSQIQRNSAFKLIRIIAILFIVTGHIFRHAFRGELSIYLVQDCYPFGGYLYNSLYEHAQSANTLLCIIVYLCVLFLLTYILEKTRRFILNKPIDKLSDFLEKKINISQE